MKKVVGRFLGTIAILSSAGCATLGELNTESLSSALNNAGAPTDTGLGDIGEHVEGGMKIAKGVNISDSDVIKNATQYASAFDQESKVAPANSPYAQRLSKLTKNHQSEDGLKLKFKVYLSPEVNAFALADGNIRVYSGLMDRLNDAELLSVIGHEIGHVKLGHSKAQLKQALIADGLTNIGTEIGASKASSSLGIGGGSIADGVMKDAVSGVTEKMKDIVLAKFSREDEKSADDYGLTFMKRNKYDPKGSVAALNKLAALSEGEESELAFLTSSHPDPEDRAERLAEQLGVPVPQTEDAPPVMLASANMDKATDSDEIPLASSEDSAPELKAMQPLDATPLDPDRTWVIQVAAEEEEMLAREKISMLAELGARAQIQQAVVAGKTYFRVLVGAYSSKAAAQADLKRVDELNIKQGEPFVKPL